MDFGGRDLFSRDVRLDEIEYGGVRDWLIKLHPITTLWNLQPTYILSQVVFIFGGITTLMHALLNGGRWPHLWIATILHGVFIEMICYLLPNVNNFWHSVTPVMFFGQRFPLHIILLYACFYYQATFAVTKMNLPLKIQPFAVGLCVVLLDIPYDIMAVKLVHWTWHDTDPNIYDRHYWVPWNSYFFHASFSAGFTFWFNYSSNWKLPAKENLGLRRCVLAELKSVACATFFGAPTGVIFFILIYHPLHDILKIHSEVTFFILFSIFCLILWTHIISAGVKISTRSGKKDFTSLLIPHLLLHYGFFFGCSIFASPEQEVSIGLHEPVGPCHEFESVRTAFGMELKKRKYLCTEDYNEAYFDFHCIPAGPPKNRAVWYGVCGTQFENRAEYIAILGVIMLIATVLFYTLHISPGRVKPDNKKKKH